MDFSLVVAHDEARGIAKKGHIPWRVPEDMKFFKTLTWGNIVIMGRKTWESLPNPLPHRYHIVLTRTNHRINTKDVYWTRDFHRALKYCENKGKKVFVIGGLQVYRDVLHHPECKELYVTEIKGNYGCDMFFPWYNEWNPVETLHESNECTIKKYIRKGEHE